jgi:hypothetical protein
MEYHPGKSSRAYSGIRKARLVTYRELKNLVYRSAILAFYIYDTTYAKEQVLGASLYA